MIKLINLNKVNNYKNYYFQKISMTDFQYGNRSINSLVEQLNSLGNRSVSIHQTELMAIQSGQNRNIRRFQSKSSSRKQFFKCHQSDKKYVYSHVVSQLDQASLTSFMKNWQQGYNCTILIQNNKEHLLKLMDGLKMWTERSLIYCIVLNQQNQLIDLLGQDSLVHRQLLENKKYYQIDNNHKAKIITEYLQFINKKQKFSTQSTFIDITFKNPVSCAELHLTLLPAEIFKSECNPPFSLIKTQLIQLLNYIKMNPNKRYEHISKLITKRLPMTNYLTKILMSDSCNLLINFIHSQNYQEAESLGKFQLFDKISVVSNLLRKADRHVVQIGILKPLSMKPEFQNHIKNPLNPLSQGRSCQQKSNISKQQIVSPIGRLKLKTENQNGKQGSETHIKEKQNYLEQKQLQFCRSLERKTHKYSITPGQETFSNGSRQKLQVKNPLSSFQENTFLDKKTISKYEVLSNRDQFKNTNLEKQFDYLITQKPFEALAKFQNIHPFSQSQQVTLLKAQHSREVSQYHQTIQLLNKKITILTQQLSLQDLYKIHERQIMLLELKIKQLRQDFIALTKDQGDDRSSKAIIKKLTEEVKSYQNTSMVKKLSQGRLFMLQKELKETKEKLSLSQKARSTLAVQVEALTKRLKIRDSQIQKINQQDIEKYQCQDLSTTEEKILQDVKKLVRAVKDQQRNSGQYLLRKISLILCDLSKSRDIILECNDFLVQLMEILDDKLSKKTPQIVLDCNKFIRSFLMDNLAIF